LGQPGWLVTCHDGLPEYKYPSINRTHEYARNNACGHTTLYKNRIKSVILNLMNSPVIGQGSLDCISSLRLETEAVMDAVCNENIQLIRENSQMMRMELLKLKMIIRKQK